MMMMISFLPENTTNYLSEITKLYLIEPFIIATHTLTFFDMFLFLLVFFFFSSFISQAQAHYPSSSSKIQLTTYDPQYDIMWCVLV